MRSTPLVLTLIFLVGCGSAQGAVSGQAEVLAASQGLRFAFYAELDASCGEEHAEDREAYRRCMRPARAVATAADAYRDGLERAQRLITADAEDDLVRQAVFELIGLAQTLVGLLTRNDVPIPEDLRGVAGLETP